MTNKLHYLAINKQIINGAVIANAVWRFTSNCTPHY